MLGEHEVGASRPLTLTMGGEQVGLLRWIETPDIPVRVRNRPLGVVHDMDDTSRTEPVDGPVGKWLRELNPATGQVEPCCYGRHWETEEWGLLFLSNMPDPVRQGHIWSWNMYFAGKCHRPDDPGKKGVEGLPGTP